MLLFCISCHCSPQLDIHTVAAGGGSRLFWSKSGLLAVGPESAGAHPGPVCYRKNGVLAVTDANLVLGRILPQEFPHIFGPNEDEPLDIDASRRALEDMLRNENIPKTAFASIEELAYGFLQVANEAMCRPIRNLTQMKGFDITSHILACFGGAGPQHACAIAKALGMSRVLIHRYGGVLSAYGLSMADAVHDVQEPAAEVYSHADGTIVTETTFRDAQLEKLAKKAKAVLVEQGYAEEDIVVEKYLNMRYEGTDNAIMISEQQGEAYRSVFLAHYQREFGFVLQGRSILVDDYRVRAVVQGRTPPSPPAVTPLGPPTDVAYQTRAYFDNQWHNDVNVYKMETLLPGHEINGPAIIVQSISTIVIEIGCTATVTADGDLDIAVASATAQKTADNAEAEVEEDPVQLSIFSHRFMGIAEQMGRTLARTAISVNMKERLDFSCALFTADGGLVANAPHIPVHLGAMQAAVTFQVEYWNSEGREGIKEGEVSPVTWIVAVGAETDMKVVDTGLGVQSSSIGWRIASPRHNRHHTCLPQGQDHFLCGQPWPPRGHWREGTWFDATPFNMLGRRGCHDCRLQVGEGWEVSRRGYHRDPSCSGKASGQLWDAQPARQPE